MYLRPLAVVGALYAVSERGLAADVLAARAVGAAPLPVCTSIVVASDGMVTDVTDVPVDTVQAQLEHLQATGAVEGIKVGILGGPKTVEAVCDAVVALGVPSVLDLVASGPNGETVLSARGIDAVADRLGVATLVTVSKADAELVTGGQIESLDDAQVAAQRLHNRGAQRVVIRCGSLPYRFYDAADDPGTPGGDGAPVPLAFDLYYDGDDFALYEASLIDGSAADGMSSIFAITALNEMVQGSPVEEALQAAKRASTEAARHPFDVPGRTSRINPWWASGGNASPAPSTGAENRT
ncbi:bifunctional hydroxymethylpyrimidine kinase/phosphomethylpyrimidine kinase [Rubrivirga sp. S365]|uniref:Bifunctional hydroxymethylpyrimidine kinase/phosphomethylpyrimidine kinase n=1 Tax=Rubrivirga litoralis TaxID=3075598 RepID=A0ABU3BTP6_9BACT|nr:MULTISPECIES: bifunctional hydroxymethylpyrimidine kinase/phosphomethylpyrimidine kinase [unclassified Rubrivirga]MDT0632666.1 bifunctional hydroxymethylpyrimidine kinase/phosphomethylpyrimidine kinase [Rubrivirga sp. F394]MDT7857157.1 bifunctional hydroxymethylpyrimidine kinase/phosphomethylpyrimidine kinase [Rubrivirga sp. S365]